MGVRGLWRFLTNQAENKDNVFQSFDLVEEAAAAGEGGLTLIVDFYPFEYWILNQVHRDIINDKYSVNPWITVSGGEYSYFGDYVTRLVKALADCHIKLVFVVNAGRCCTTGQMDFKYSRWMQTDLRDMKRVADIIEAIELAPAGGNNGTDDGETVRAETASSLLAPTRDSKTPTLLPVELVERLLRAGCEVLSSLDGEPDPFIAELFNKRRAFAILSNDSDMLLFENCRYVNIEEHFDASGKLAAFLSPSYLHASGQKLSELIIRCVFSNDVYRTLGLPSLDAACDLSFVLGNDVSKFFPELFRRLGLQRFGVMSVVSRLRRLGSPLPQSPAFRDLFADPNFGEAYRLTHQLYKQELAFDDDEKPFVDDAKNVDEIARRTIGQAVQHCRVGGHCLAMSRGFYWNDAKIVEQSNDNYYSAEAACLPLRLVIYKMLMASGKNEVVEYRPMAASQTTIKTVFSLKEMEVKNSMLAELPNISEVDSMDRSARLALFDRIVNRCYVLDDEEDVENVISKDQDRIFERFDQWPFAFLVYACRLIWLANKSDNLKLTKFEMESVIVTVIASSVRLGYVDVAIEAASKPTRRSLTVGSFVQMAYRYLYDDLAKMLHLADVNDSLPLPSSFFSGSLFTALFNSSLLSDRINKMRGEILEKQADACRMVFGEY